MELLEQEGQDHCCLTAYLGYTAPGRQFETIRMLQERVGSKRGIHVDQPLVIGLNVSEWLGHERERYWEILLKFASDMQCGCGWKLVFFLDGCKQEQLLEMFSGMLDYFKVQLLTEQSADKASLMDRILEYDSQALLESDVMDYLAEQLCNKPLLEKHLEQVLGELLSTCEGETVTMEATKAYMADPDSTYSLLNKADRNAQSKGGKKIGFSI